MNLKLTSLFNIFKLTKFLSRFEFVQYGLCSNHWIWIHILGCATIARISSVWLSSWASLGIVAAAAILVELIEYKLETPTRKDMRKLYGTVNIYKYDTAGDILAGLAAAILVLF